MQFIEELMSGTFTIDQNILGAPKRRNDFWYAIKILSQYWTFLYYSQFSYRSFNFAIAKVVALSLFASYFALVFNC